MDEGLPQAFRAARDALQRRLTRDRRADVIVGVAERLVAFGWPDRAGPFVAVGRSEAYAIASESFAHPVDLERTVRAESLAGAVHRARGALDEAVRACHTTQWLSSLLEPPPPLAVRALARSHAELGRVRVARGLFQPALESLDQALALLGPAEGASVEARVERASVESVRVGALRELGRADEPRDGSGRVRSVGVELAGSRSWDAELSGLLEALRRSIEGP